MKIQHADDYRQLRKEQYPAIGEQLDILWKIMLRLNACGLDLGEDGREMLQRIVDIKATVPKLVSTVDEDHVVKLPMTTDKVAEE